MPSPSVRLPWQNQDGQTGRQADRQTGRQADRQRGREAERQTGRQAEGNMKAGGQTEDRRCSQV